jgi:NAD+ synthase
MTFTRSVLEIDPLREIPRVCDFIREITLKRFKRRGAVVGLSGGVDSAVIASLCVEALGAEKVLGLVLPERESNPVSQEYALKQAGRLGIQALTIEITGILECLGLYGERDAVIRGLLPDFDASSRFHVTLPQNLLDKDRINYHTITVQGPECKRREKRLSSRDWLKIAACQNMKQRIRMVQLYHHAERNNYLVAGTTNKTELLQGFYVKFGDGGVDIEPIAHLYKTQVFQLARELGVIEEIIRREPSPDTYSLPVTDKEFYFCMDFGLLDLLLYAYERELPAAEVSRALGLGQAQVTRAFKDFKAKEGATWHLREMPPGLNRDPAPRSTSPVSNPDGIGHTL